MTKTIFGYSLDVVILDVTFYMVKSECRNDECRFAGCRGFQ